MRYPVVNLHRMGGLLEEYQKENSAFKDKLSRMNQEAAAREAAARAGQPVYHAPSWPPAPPPPPPPPTTTGGATYFGPRPGPMVATGQPKPPPPNVVYPVVPPQPPPQPPGLPPYAPPTVATGIPPMPYSYPFREYPYPPIPPRQDCPPGYTWTPAGCRQDVPSIDRWFPPTTVSAPPPAPVITPGASSSLTPTQGTIPTTQTPATEMAPGVASVDCPAGQFWDGRQCRGSIGTMPGMDVSAASSLAPGMMNVASAGMTAAGSAFMGQVPLRANPDLLGAPRLTRQLRIVRNYW